MNMIQKLILVVLFFGCGALSLRSQETLTQQAVPPPAPVDPGVAVRAFSIGPSAAMGIVLNGTDNFTLPTVPSCCPGYEGTTGSGIILGAEFGMPVSPTIDFIVRLVYQSANTDFSTDEPTTVRVGNSTVNTSLLHTMATTSASLFAEPMISYGLAGGLALLGGVRVGTVLSGTYDQSERLADPSLPYDFVGGRSTNNVSAGDIPNTASFQMGLVLGLRYRLPMNAGGTLSLVPEVTYSPMFTSMVSDASWTVSPIRIGLAVIFDIMKTVREATPLRP